MASLWRHCGVIKRNSLQVFGGWLDLHWSDAHVRYYAGLAKQALGDTDGARGEFEAVLAAHGWSADLPYYQALTLKALGRVDEAEAKLAETLDRATRQLEEQAKQGFATSVPQFVFAEEDMETRRRTHLTYVIGLAHLGLGQATEAEKALKDVLKRDPNHFGAQLALRELK